MRLKSIKLAGFKSFVDPTTVPFQSNMTAIVGPNGCGKSNVIDAVRWVMGESSARHLRGESMTDVIFNGSTSRKPVSRAAIELVFDNSEGLVSGEFASFAEISVKREVSREGQSRYFLNGISCRRRDVTDLFLGTGLGPRSYAIIEQGMIARIVEAKPEELRTYVEEAAGVSKYRERRRETESRISRTRENLDRLDDLSDELGRQLDRLKRQAEAAERYKTLKAESRNLGSLILWYQQQDQKEKQQSVSLSKSECQKYLDQLASALSSNERARVDAQVAREDANQALDEANTAFYTHAATLSRLETSKESYQQQIRQLSANRVRVDMEISGLKQLIVTDRDEGITAAQGQSTLAPELEKTGTDLEAIEYSIRNSEDDINTLDLDLGHLLSEFRRVESELTRLETAKKGLDRQQGLEAARLQDIDQARSELIDTDPNLISEMRVKVSELFKRIEKEKIEFSELQLAVDQSQNLVLDEEESLRHLQGLNQTAEAELDKARRIIEAEARIDSHEISVWVAQQTSIIGRVVEHIQIPAQDRSAFEAAYPELLAAFVSENFESLTLENMPSGLRVVSLDYLNALPKQIKKVGAFQLTNHEAYTESGLRFGPGWVERIVGRATGILDLKARVPDLEQNQLEISRQANDVEERLGEALNAQDLAQGQFTIKSDLLQAIEKESVQLSNRLAGLEARDQEITTSRERLEREKQSLLDGRLQAQEEHSELDRRSSELIRLQESIQEQINPLRQSLDNHKAELGRLRDERNKKMNMRSDLRVEIERLSGIKSRSDKQVERLENQLSGLQRELEVLSQDSASLMQSPGVSDEELKAAVAKSQKLEQELQTARQILSEKDQLLTKLEGQRVSIEHDRESRSQAMSEIRLTEQAIDIELNRLDDELKARNAEEIDLFEVESRFKNRPNAEAELDRIKTRIDRLGPINLVALNEYQNELERKSELDHQHSELREALETLEDAIRKIDRETRSLFRRTFDAINQSFGEVFPKLFGGGEAWLMLTDEDLLSTGVTIMARPPGKRNSSIYLLSGGEKALTALSLVFAIFQLNPAPFCFLDEVDAPLDDANVGRYAAAVANMSQEVQFIFITHNKISMERAEQLMGVTMSEPGVSRLVSVDIERAVELATTE
ncbi:MAG TPA: chromosome segregation protein SMC [Gammaproteobacteria bacterium]|nr:chromosome segregation protein SMC [Gammaproteobacteria bacterium]